MRSDGGLGNEYLNWILQDQLGFHGRESEKIRDVCEWLMTINYTWNNNFDENRANDGLYLRREFLDEEYPDDVFGSAKVLEVLAEFAIRIDSEYTGDPSDPRAREIFHMFLENLGLLGRVNVKKNQETFISMRVDRWMRKEPGLIFGFENSAKNGSLWQFMLKWVSIR